MSTIQGPGGMPERIELQARVIHEFCTLEFPRVMEYDKPETITEKIRRFVDALNALSSEGYSIQNQLPFGLLLGRMVRIEQIQVDVSRVVMPMRTLAR